MTTNRNGIRALALTCALSAMLAGCSPPRSAQRGANPLEAPPIDTTKVRSADEAADWKYRQELAVDLDGDRQAETLVIAADVELADNGDPLWEDGHRWAVYVDSPQGRTLLYAAFVPNGFVEAAALTPSDDGRRKVLVQERIPSQLRALEVEYLAPRSARLSSGAYYQIQSWLPGSAALPQVPPFAQVPAVSSVAPNAGPSITTDRRDYTLVRGPVGREARIVASFRAPTDQTVYIVHCNGAISWGIQKQVAGRWVDAWAAETNACLSAPIVLRAGEVHTDTLTLVSRDDVPPGPGTVRHKVEPGMYRMIWYGVLTSFDANARPGRPLGADLPAEARVSGPIRVRESG